MGTTPESIWQSHRHWMFSLLRTNNHLGHAKVGRERTCLGPDFETIAQVVDVVPHALCSLDVLRSQFLEVVREDLLGAVAGSWMGILQGSVSTPVLKSRFFDTLPCAVSVQCDNSRVEVERLRVQEVIQRSQFRTLLFSDTRQSPTPVPLRYKPVQRVGKPKSLGFRQNKRPARHGHPRGKVKS